MIPSSFRKFVGLVFLLLILPLLLLSKSFSMSLPITFSRPASRCRLRWNHGLQHHTTTTRRSPSAFATSTSLLCYHMHTAPSQSAVSIRPSAIDRIAAPQGGNTHRSFLYAYNSNSRIHGIFQQPPNDRSTPTKFTTTRLMSTRTATFYDNDDSSPNSASVEEPKKTKKDKKKAGGKSKGSAKKLFRADRVLSNRSPNWSRSESFDILKKKRVYMEVPSTSTSASPTTVPERKRINGPSEKIPMDAVLYVDNKTLIGQPPPMLQVFHKPKWMLSVMNDSHGRKNVGQLQEQGQGQDNGGSTTTPVFLSKSMHPVGRLDYDTSGLLLFSSEGKLTQALLHPTSGIEKEYVAIVEGLANEDKLREQLADGVETSMGVFPGQLISAKPIESPDDVSSIINHIMDNLPPEYDLSKLEEKGYLDFRNAELLSEVRVVVQEGKHRMVRRILANCGHPVIGLRRERLGPILLGDLPEGTIRDLTQDEAEWAKSILESRKSSKQNK